MRVVAIAVLLALAGCAMPTGVRPSRLTVSTGAYQDRLDDRNRWNGAATVDLEFEFTYPDDK